MNLQQKVREEKDILVKQQKQRQVTPSDNCKPELKVKSGEAVRKRGRSESQAQPSTSKVVVSSRSSRRRRKRREDAVGKLQSTDEPKGTNDRVNIPSKLNDTKNLSTGSLSHYKIPKRGDGANTKKGESNGSVPVKSPAVAGIKRDHNSLPKLNTPGTFPNDDDTKTRHSFSSSTASLVIENDERVRKRKRKSGELDNTTHVHSDLVDKKNRNEHLLLTNALTGTVNAKSQSTALPATNVRKGIAVHGGKDNSAVIQEASSSPISSGNTKQHVTPSQCEPVYVTKDFSEAEAMEFENQVAQIMEMVDGTTNSIPYDLTDAMDVDMIPSFVRKQLVIILDTNVWIDSQDSIKRLIQLEYQQGIRPLLIIPWMVLQEIDFKTKRHTNSSSFNGFRSANKFIHSLLSSKTPNVKGQKATEAIIGMEFNELMADDSILNCAIQYSKLPQCITVFITSDVNLLNKALVHNITSFKPDKGLLNNVRQLVSGAEIRDDFEGSFEKNQSNMSHFSNSSVLKSPAQDSVSCGKDTTQGEIGMDILDIDDPMDGNCPLRTVSCETQSAAEINLPSFETVVISLKQALTSIIVPKMVEEYGEGEEGWKFAIKIKPPFTVESGLKCIHAHWIAVFSFMFPSKSKEVLDELLQVFRTKPNQPSEVSAWRITVCKMALVFLSMSDIVRSRQRVSETCKLLQTFLRESNPLK
ncbi:Transcriptional protein SWT1 [Orchesella cincta]|uniref:Transcriptional protein SWT1 n=1 Tax=Orchesella cincta TaxID=48709 RepID=A0A1D2MBI7_ORCCI|nr:Transcriptional protein SWT1 [Orchesella cincta]